MNVWIERVEIGVFGGLTAQRYEWKPGFTIWYGPNEAGKSTLIAFIRYMLYGFGRGEASRYEPGMGASVGGALTLRNESGDLLRLERSNGRGAPQAGELKVWLNGEPTRSDELRRWLGAISSDLYRSLFAFGLEELKELQSLAAGELGAYLYGASVAGGGGRVLAAERRLAGELEQLYRPRGRMQPLARSLEKLANLEGEQRIVTAQASEYSRLQTERERAVAERLRLEQLERATGAAMDRALAYASVAEHALRAIRLKTQLHGTASARPFPEHAVARFEAMREERERLEGKQRMLRYDAERLRDLLASAAPAAERTETGGRRSVEATQNAGWQSALGYTAAAVALVAGLYGVGTGANGWGAAALLAGLLLAASVHTANGRRKLAQMAESYTQRLEDLRRSDSETAVWRERLAAVERELADVQGRCAVLTGRERELLQAADADGEEDLRRRERESADRLRQQKELDQAEALVYARLGREEGEAAAANLAVWQERDWVAEAERQRESYERIRRDKEAATQQLGRLEERLQGIAGDSRQAELAQLYEEEESEARNLMEGWLVRSLCQALIRDTKLDYENDRQPAVLKNAGRLLSTLTNGRYVKAAAPFGQLAVTLERADGRRFEPARLSRGTSEQLYIALRLALAEQMGERIGRLPMLFDDIAVHFDDERLRRFLRVLSELGQNRQILLFTCHERVRMEASGLASVSAVMRVPDGLQLAAQGKWDTMESEGGGAEHAGRPALSLDPGAS